MLFSTSCHRKCNIAIYKQFHKYFITFHIAAESLAESAPERAKWLRAEVESYKARAGLQAPAKDGKVSLSLASSAPTQASPSPTHPAWSVKINQSFSNSNVVYDYGHLFPSHGNLIHHALHFDALWRNQNALCIFSHYYFYCYCPLGGGFFPALPLRTKCA